MSATRRDQLGDEDPRFTLRVYAQATKRRDRLAKPQREAFDRAIEWALMAPTRSKSLWRCRRRQQKTPPERGFQKSG
jgi:hypothetical protein